jgi:hypothetical protein
MSKSRLLFGLLFVLALLGVLPLGHAHTLTHATKRQRKAAAATKKRLLAHPRLAQPVARLLENGLVTPYLPKLLPAIEQLQKGAIVDDWSG